MATTAMHQPSQQPTLLVGMATAGANGITVGGKPSTGNHKTGAEKVGNQEHQRRTSTSILLSRLEIMTEKEPAPIDDAEKHFLERLCSAPHSDLSFCLRVDVTGLKKSKKGSKRILALGSYVLYLVKKVKLSGAKKASRPFPGAVKLKIVKEFPLLDLRTITVFPGSQAKLQLEFAKKAPIVLQSSKVPEILQAIRSTVRMFTNGFPNTRLPALFGIEESKLLPLEPCDDYGPAHGLLYTYCAYCFYYKQPVSAEIMRYVTDLYDAGLVEFSLADCPGAEHANGLHFNMLPVAAALRFNTYFRSLSATNVIRKDLLPHISNIFRDNTTMTQLVLSHLSAVADLTELGAALNSNDQHALQMLDLKDMTLRCSSVLFSALAQFPHALRVLRLNNCSMEGKHINNLFVAFSSNFGMSLTIEELDLSNNKFEEQGCVAFETWLSRAAEYANLRILKLANTNQSLSTSAAYFHFLAILEELDLSRNKLDLRAIQLLCSMVEKTSTLQVLNVSGCSLSGKSAAAITSAMLQNRRLRQTRLNLSSNDMAEPDAEYLAQALTRNYNCHTLDLSKNKWKEKGLIGLLQSIVLSASTTLHTLRLDNTFKTSYAGERAASALMSVTNSLENVRSISLVGGFGSVALHFMEYLQTNHTVEELDVSSNSMGDVGASCITTLLRHNKTLVRLCCDGNNISPSGWKMVLGSFIRNTTLLFLDFPWQDYNKWSSGLQQLKLTELRNVLIDIQRALQFNQKNTEANLDRFSLPPVPPPPSFVQPLAEVPKQLSFDSSEKGLSSLAAEKIVAKAQGEAGPALDVPVPEPPAAAATEISAADGQLGADYGSDASLDLSEDDGTPAAEAESWAAVYQGGGSAGSDFSEDEEEGADGGEQDLPSASDGEDVLVDVGMGGEEGCDDSAVREIQQSQGATPQEEGASSATAAHVVQSMGSDLDEGSEVSDIIYSSDEDFDI